MSPATSRLDVKRRLAAAALLAATIWLPTAMRPSVVQAAAVCTGWSSTTAPPPTIRVLRTSGVVETVDFETYVKVVMPAEWPPTWPIESMRAGAVAIKQYAWYYTMHYRNGLTGVGGCADVYDSSNDQIYKPETYSPAAAHIQAVESTWSESIFKYGSFVFTGYRPGSTDVCGADADGAHLYQKSARGCALAGKTGEQILEIYYGPGLVIQTPTTYHALTPARILDSRDGYWMGLAGAFKSHVARTFQVAGRGGVPGNATAVTGNLTVTGQTSLGYLYIGPFAANDPTSSTLNFPLGDDRANGGTVALGGGGTLAVTYAAATLGPTAQVSFDVTGYFTPDTSGATYHALAPTRLLDSRDGYWIGLAGAFSSNVARTFGVAGREGVPTNATAVTGNLTVTGQTSLGYVYMGPYAANNPTSSTLNFPLGDDRANGVTVALGGGGTLAVTYAAVPGATAQVIFDVTGYFTPDTSGATYHALAPAR